MKILVTGGTGYIGSHTCVELLNAGHDVEIVDNLSNSSEKSIEGIKEITGKNVTFHKCDCNDVDALDKIFKEGNFDGVIHFAASKMVGESVKKPLMYYRNNLVSLMNVLELMNKHKVKNIVFSSSCSVYGQAEELPVTEETPLAKAESPYGNTKKICEDILIDTTKSSPISAVALRYFNVIGAHPSSKIGDNPNGIPESIAPVITQFAAGKRDKLVIFGNQFETPDGYQVRDYVHVVDLAKAHVKAIEFSSKQSLNFFDVFNIGTGKGTSVLEIIEAFKTSTGVDIKYEVGDPRPGDIVKIWANAEKVNKELGWKAELTVADAMRDAWNWEIAVR